MSKHWKEPYTKEAAQAVGIHTFEGVRVVGEPDSPWIFYVRVCGFTFGFFSLDMLREYIAYYSLKVLPSSRFFGRFATGPAASVGDGQGPFDRLPTYLRSRGKRGKVQRALEKALRDFERECV